MVGVGVEETGAIGEAGEIGCLDRTNLFFSWSVGGRGEGTDWTEEEEAAES